MMVYRLLSVLAWLAVPLLFLHLLITGKGDIQSLKARLGYGSPSRADRRPIWLHASSVGELNTLRALLPSISLAFPGLTMGAMPASSGGASAKLDAETQAEVDAAQAGGPFQMAHGMAYDDVIDPRELRNALLSALVLCEGRDAGPVEPVRR